MVFSTKKVVVDSETFLFAQGGGRMANIAGMSNAIVAMCFSTFLANRYRNTKYQASNFKKQIGFANV